LKLPSSSPSVTTAEPPPIPATNYWRDLFIWLIVAAAFALRIGYNLALHPDGHPITSFVIDEREYFSAAHMLAEGRGFSYFDTALWVRPPLYVTALAGVMRLAGSDYFPALLFQSLLSALTLLPLGWLAFRLGGRRPARLAVAIGLLYLPLTLFAGLLLSETLFVFLFAWALVALVKAHKAIASTWSRQTWLWLIMSGLLLGLCVLARATALAFLPLVALWLLWGRGASVLRSRLAAAAIVVGVCLLCLVPWIARNYLAYKRFVLVDTTSGYNLWLASVGVRDEPRLQADLLAIPNPADRQGYAYARAWENISADPLAFIGKGVKESLDLWRPLFSAEERQAQGFSLGRIPAWHLVSLLLFDDLLYVVILVAAVAGLALGRPDPLKSLTLLWAALWVLMSFVFFAVTRFRLPVVAAFIPWAAVGLEVFLTRRVLPERARRATPAARILAGAAVVGVAIFVVPAIDVGDTWLGIERWFQQGPYRSAEVLLRQRMPDEAIAQYDQANLSVSDTRYGLAAAFLQKGEAEQALAQLTESEPDDRVEPLLIRGEAARMAGNLASARSFFNARTLQVQPMEAEDWAWDHLAPPPTSTLQLGSGLDMGYIRGFYGPEKDNGGRTFRWSSADAHIRDVQVGAGYELQWSGWRPDGLASASPVVSQQDAQGRMLGMAQPFPLQNSLSWTTSQIAPVAGQVETLIIKSNPFIGGGNDPRLLGVRISAIGSR
jgi:4-amino-4-deoxy-L-arabinose transferase-like glycosyltransferase